MLKRVGLDTVKCVLDSSLEELLQIKGKSDLPLPEIIEAASKMVHVGSAHAEEIHHASFRVISITTGSKKLDDILQGGIKSVRITKMYRGSNSGKTQLCHTLCVTCQLPLDQEGTGTGSKALYIDVEGTFGEKTLSEIAERVALMRKGEGRIGKVIREEGGVTGSYGEAMFRIVTGRVTNLTSHEGAFLWRETLPEEEPEKAKEPL